MGAVLVGHNKSRNPPMLSRKPHSKRDEITHPTRSSKNGPCNGNKGGVISTNIPVDSEVLREWKRRVLVCLDNNATADQVARSIISDCPDWSALKEDVSDMISNTRSNNNSNNNNNNNNNNSNINATNSKRRHLEVRDWSDSNTRNNPYGVSLRRKCVSTNVSTVDSVDSSSLHKPRVSDDISPVEVVSECFDLLDRLLSDIARKDNEISLLQMQLTTAEQNSHIFEKRLNYMKQYCHSNGVFLGEMPAEVKMEPEIHPTWSGSHASGPSRWQDTSYCLAPYPVFGDVNADMEDLYQCQPETKPQCQGSPRKSRRSSMDMLALPSIHDSTGKNFTDTMRSQSADSMHTSVAVGRKRRGSGIDAVQADSGGCLRWKKSRLSIADSDSKLDEETGDAEDDSHISDDLARSRKRRDPSVVETGAAGGANRSRDRKLKRKRSGRRNSRSCESDSRKTGEFEEANQKIAGILNCMTTSINYYYGDFDTMLSRREKEMAARQVLDGGGKHIDTPGWRIAPLFGRTRAATHAAAAAAAATNEHTNGEALAEPSVDIPAEGSGFEEWAALSDEPFENRHYRHEQQEKKREKAEQRAYREYQRHARLRARQQYLQQPGGGLTATTVAEAAESSIVCPGSVTGSALSGGIGSLAPVTGASSDTGVVEIGTTASLRRGLPDSLLPDPVDESEIKNCRLHYYSKDKMPVIAFGKLLRPRRKNYHGFTLPWVRRGR